MADFIFDRDIFQRKFVQNNGDIIRNRAKSIVSNCDSICPNNTDNGNKYAGYKSRTLLADMLHNLFGVAISEKKASRVNLLDEVEKQVVFNGDKDKLKTAFKDIMTSFYFGDSNNSKALSIALLRYQPASEQKDFGKFVYDVLLDDTTKKKFQETLKENTNPLDNIVNHAYENLNILKKLKMDKEYSPVFKKELTELFEVMNADIQEVLKSHSDILPQLEFLISYYVFIYLSQFALRLDYDLDDKKVTEHIFPFFKAEKEAVSEDRDCVAQGWRRIDKKTKKLFEHMIVLNMLNCHTNDTSYNTYSDLYRIYNENEDERNAMDDAVDYIITEYTVRHSHDTDIPGEKVDFSAIKVPDNEAASVERFKLKVKYIYECVSYELESKIYRKNVVSYVASNYNHILKMRFVKSWGQLGHMIIISNEDLIMMIQICQMSSRNMNHERGIQISDLFDELKKRGLYMDGKTKQYVIEYLISINLIDSKCDSEEAQYVKRIQ